MRFEVIDAGEDAETTAERLRALVEAPESVSEAVADIIADVRERGDAALAEYTRAFDPDAAPKRVEAAELDEALTAFDPAVREGLKRAADNVRRVCEAAIERDQAIRFDEHTVTLRHVPVARAAVYVPGGRAPYLSTVVMGVVPARVAGVAEVVVATPSSAVLGACALAGVTEVHRMGGAQAIAALAYGTESTAPVDVIVGPGNLYVQEAKRQVSANVGIDGFAGPSDLVAIADSQIDPEPLALDLLAQAEHGPGTLVVAISTDRALLEALAALMEHAPETGASVTGVEVPRLDRALSLAQELAPEHLQLVGPHAEGLAKEITTAGCVFVGANAGTAFGDYIAGSNHILPTNGAARFASGLSVNTFRRTQAQVQIDDATVLAQAAAPIARAEGFEYHARSMEARIRDNQSETE